MRRVLLCMLLVLTLAISSATAGVPRGWYPLPFSLLTLSGEIVTENYLRRGPAAMIFWNTSNPLSSTILDDFKGYHERFGDDELKIIAVHSGDGALTAGRLREVMAYADRKDLPFPVLVDWDRKAQRSYRISEFPSTVLFDDDGRAAFSLSGYPRQRRRELAANLHSVMGREEATGGFVAVRSQRDIGRERNAGTGEPSAACRIPRSLHCLITAERSVAPSDPSVMAVRLSVCRGDIDNARNMMRGIRKGDYSRSDLRFALGNMMLLKGSIAEAEKAFSGLLELAPGEGWGSWGLGLSALAAGKTGEAVRHMRKGAALDGGNPEAETAVLRYLEEYWRADRKAPREREFLALFSELSSVRDCYRQASGKG